MEQGNNTLLLSSLQAIAEAIKNQNIFNGIVPVKFRAWNTANGTLSAIGDTKITFDTEDYDTGNNFDKVNGRFTAPFAGWYHFDVIAHVSANASGHNVQLRKNGAIISIGQEISATTGTVGMAMGTDLYLSTNDYVEFFVFNSAGATRSWLGTNFRTQFSGRLVAIT